MPGMTLLIVPVAGQDADELRAQVEAALADGAEAIELRVDLMGEISADDLRTLRSHAPAQIPFILTIRSAAEGGAWDGDDDERVSRLIELGPFVEYIDVELSLWRRSANIRQKIELALHRADHVSQHAGKEEIEFAARRKLLLSSHEVTTRPTTLMSRWVDMVGESACAVPKLAWPARTVRDNFEALELIRDCPRRPIVICMGAEGLVSRVLAKKFAAFGTFAALRAGQETAPGQIPIAEFKRRYRWDAIDGATRVYGVIGHPVGHSLSPAVHNAAFTAEQVNAVYLSLPVTPSYEAFKAFMVEILARPWLGFGGFSVTLPHKENALRFLQERGSRVGDLAARLGAVNTLILSADGAITGENTDYPAAEYCIREATQLLADCKSPLRAAVLGAGGVGRAIVAALVDAGTKVTIYNRTPDRAAELARTFGCEHAAWDERHKLAADLIVNCTSVGLAPRHGESPLPAVVLHSNQVVFDTIYRPVETRLLHDARAAGCRVVDGMTMFLRQAREQFTLWTGREVPPDVLLNAATDALSANPERGPT